MIWKKKAPEVLTSGGDLTPIRTRGRVRGCYISAKSLKSLEAATGFEPVNNGFADRCLTTWLCRLARVGYQHTRPESHPVKAAAEAGSASPAGVAARGAVQFRTASGAL